MKCGFKYSSQEDRAVGMNELSTKQHSKQKMVQWRAK